MDAKDFLKEFQRMCKLCSDCPVYDKYGCYCHNMGLVGDEFVDIVERWSNEHPVKTRQSVFLEQYPNARMWRDEEQLAICPQHLDVTRKCPGFNCYECHKQYWLEEVE